jgi:Rnl2 family RNA ligase
LSRKLDEICSENNWNVIKVHGEGYGGKQQKMSATYGPKLRFIAFDIYIETDESTFFLDVPVAEEIVQKLNLEFVHYVRGPNQSEWIENQSNMESVQAIRNGMGSGKLREGIVVRPLSETKMKNGKRAIFKHKNAEFWEIRTRRPLGERVKVVEVVNEIVNDWVTENRFQHVVDRILQQKDNKNIETKDIRLFLELMVEDVKRESEGEVVWSENLARSIRQKSAQMFKTTYPQLSMRVN